MFDFFKRQKLFGAGSEQVNSPPEDPDPGGIRSFNDDFHDYLMELSGRLFPAEDNSNIIMDVLKTACRFYDADWCGIIIADLTTNIWEPAVWYHTKHGEMSKTLFSDFNFFEDFPTWVKSWQALKPIVIPDTEAVRVSSPHEYEQYLQLHARSIIGIPFGLKPTGFLIIRNTQKHKDKPDFAVMATYVAMRTYYEREIESDKEQTLKSAKENGSSDETCIHIFGEPEIRNALGVVNVDQYDSYIGWQVLIYLILLGRAAPAKRIAADVWPDEDPDGCVIKIRQGVHRMRRRLTSIQDGENEILITTSKGYSLNPEMKIRSDAEIMDQLYEEAHRRPSGPERIEILKKIQTIYRGPIYEKFSDEPWLIQAQSHYSLLYLNATELLLEELALLQDYACIHEYGSAALQKTTGNVKIYYRLIWALTHLGGKEAAERNYQQACRDLTDREFQELSAILAREFTDSTPD